MWMYPVQQRNTVIISVHMYMNVSEYIIDVLVAANELFTCANDGRFSIWVNYVRWCRYHLR